MATYAALKWAMTSYHSGGNPMLALDMLLYYGRMRYQGHSFALLLCAALAGAAAARPDPNPNSDPPSSGLAAWYGEELRGKTMANGQPFDPDQLTAASWFYPLGTQLRISLNSTGQPPRSVVVKVTDRGPRRDLVKQGRIIDLSQSAFRKLAPLELGLIPVTVEQLTNAPSSRANYSMADVCPSLAKPVDQGIAGPVNR